MSESLDYILRSLIKAMDPALADRGAEDLLRLMKKMQEPVGPKSNTPTRWQDGLIEELIPAGSSVLDLGCGEGQLLARLIHDKRVRGQGIELDPEAVFRCVERQVPVLQSDLDGGLKGFPDNSFDYVILEETLQTLHRPTDVLAEVLRVGRTGIISFPNFGYWQVRLSLLLDGRMPVTSTLSHQWYNTPNIHLLSLNDFVDWAQEHQVGVVQGYALVEGQVRPLEPQDSLYAEEVLLVIEKEQGFALWQI